MHEDRLKPANDNPWYCLATLYGEQPVDSFDEQLAQNNQQAWRRWIGGQMPESELRNLFFARTKKSELPPPTTKKVDLTFTLFDRFVSFQGFAFQAEIDFSSSRFCCGATFNEAQFLQISDFQSVRFVGDVTFDRTQFHGSKVDLGYTEFDGKAYFRSARLANANFTAAKFRDDGNFVGAEFFNKANFRRATFSAYALFNKAKFYEYVDFAESTLAWASFRSATFSSEVSFRDVIFSDLVHFTNAKFGSETIFVRARFKAGVPDFRGATMHEATEWHDVVWPEPPRKKDQAYDQVYAYERLKQEMERLKKHEDEQNFFRRELRARRTVSRPLSISWWLNLAYQASSDYGVSVVRPMLWLFGIFAAGAAIFALIPIHCGERMPTRLAIKLSFANIFVFLPDRREIMTMEMAKCLSDTTRAVSSIQSISGVVVLFLLGLALRNRFRMK